MKNLEDIKSFLEDTYWNVIWNKSEDDCKSVACRFDFQLSHIELWMKEIDSKILFAIGSESVILFSDPIAFKMKSDEDFNDAIKFIERYVAYVSQFDFAKEVFLDNIKNMKTEK